MTRSRIWFLSAAALVLSAVPALAYWPALFGIPTVFGQESSGPMQAESAPSRGASVLSSAPVQTTSSSAGQDGSEDCDAPECPILGDCLTAWQKLWKQGEYAKALSLAKCAAQAAPRNLAAQHALTVSQIVQEMTGGRHLWLTRTCEDGAHCTEELAGSCPDAVCPRDRSVAVRFQADHSKVGHCTANQCTSDKACIAVAQPDCPASFTVLLPALQMPLLPSIFQFGDMIGLDFDFDAEACTVADKACCASDKCCAVADKGCCAKCAKECKCCCTKAPKQARVSSDCGEQVIRHMQMPHTIFIVREPFLPMLPNAIPAPPAYGFMPPPNGMGFMFPGNYPVRAPLFMPHARMDETCANEVIPIDACPIATRPTWVGPTAICTTGVCPTAATQVSSNPPIPVRTAAVHPTTSNGFVKIQQKDGTCLVRTANYEARCDRVSGSNEEALFLEGNVRLTSTRHGQTLVIEANRVILNVRENRFQVENARTIDAPRVNVAPLTSSVSEYQTPSLPVIPR